MRIINLTLVLLTAHCFGYSPRLSRDVKDDTNFQSDEGQLHSAEGQRYSLLSRSNGKRAPGYEGYAPWVDRTISYHLFGEAATKLRKDFYSAIQLWYKVGLPSSFKHVEVSEAECSAKLAHCLRVYYTDTGHFVTSFRSSDPAKRSHGQRMILSDNLELAASGWGLRGIIAHEIGHAWGLRHMHQDPKFWVAALGGHYQNEENNGNLFGQDCFHCENAFDYDEVFKGIQSSNEEQVAKNIKLKNMCKSQFWAEMVGFSGASWLPRKGVKSHDRKLDLTSIMLYPSRQASRGQSLVLKSPSGEEMLPNNEPSKYDVEAIIAENPE